jgi:O6-methylguanine-DNA--protein-cysteine methyltransferase
MRCSECGNRKVVFHTVFGWAGVAVSGRGVTRIVLPKAGKKAVEQELAAPGCGTGSAEKRTGGSKDGAEQLLDRTVTLLKRYFSGEDVRFDLPLDIGYYTPFQQAVWRAAMAIPSGETRSYAWVAARIRKPKAARAVGQAMGANPVPVMVP